MKTQNTRLRFLGQDGSGQHQSSKYNITDNYTQSPEMGVKKMNNKVNVTLAPIETPQVNGRDAGGRNSLMSMKGIEENEGSESHPILRVQHYKKHQLEKINHPVPTANGVVDLSMNGDQQQNGKIQMPFQPNVPVEQQ